MAALSIFPTFHDKPILVTDDTSDASEVVLVIDIERHESFCSSPVSLAFSPSDEHAAGALAERDAEIERLQRAIDQQVGAITRVLTPPEARALAATLIHFAAEAERP